MRYGILALLILSSCVPDLEDGRYGCEDGVCPDGFTCRGDSLCYGPDAPPSPMYSLCADDAECDSGVCNNHPAAVDTPPGLCTKTCMVDSDCNAAGLPDAICTMGMCFRECAGAGDCDSPAKCVATPGRDPIMICVRVEDRNFEGIAGCTTDANCMPPLRCRASNPGEPGICGWPCGGGSECPGDSECRNLPAGSLTQQACVSRCTNSGECTNGADCVASSMPNVKYCGAANWTFPL